MITITKILARQEGIGRTGNPWIKNQVEVKYNDMTFPATVWGDVEPGEYTGKVLLSGREWNGKHYPEINLAVQKPMEHMEPVEMFTPTTQYSNDLPF